MSLKAFDIDLIQPDKVLVYELDTDFWKIFENSLVEKGKLTATVSVTKSPRSIRLLFTIQGKVVLVCDRSLEVFDYPVQIEKAVDFKWGHENKELDMDLYMLEEHASILNIAQHLYDFISLAIPMKKIHPRYSTMSGE